MTTISRGINILRTVSSFYWSRISKQTTHWGKPISISVEPTTACNLGCPECPSGLKQFSRPTGKLNARDFTQWLDQLSEFVSYITLYFQGEPYLNPQFIELVKIANERKIFTATSTNAHFLDSAIARNTIESGLNKLIISIDGTTQEVYEQYRRNGSLKKVLDGTKKIVKWKKELKSKTPEVIFQFLVVRPNEHQIDEVHSLANDCGVDKVVFKTAQVYDYKEGNPLIPENEKYSRYRKLSDGTFQFKNSMKNNCWRLWSSCVITWDGKVVPCCFDKDANHILGDLNKQSFGDIWNGEPYHEFRKTLLNSRKEIDICKNCSEGTKVWIEP